MPFENINLIPIYISIGAGVLLVALALWKKALTIPATASAFIILVLAALFTSYTGVVVFSVSFVGAAVIGQIKRDKRKDREQGLYPHQGARGLVQVLCNSLPALTYGAVYFATGRTSFLIASAVTVCAGIADSAASDLGILSDGKVISLLTFKNVERGMSGGVSLLGTFSALLTSITIASITFAVGEVGLKGLWVIALMGFVGTLIDSLLGASVQAGYRCNVCLKLTERKEHCSAPTTLVKGLKFVDNNVVNVVSLFIAGAISLIF
ncbi:MAG: DUF92 domain-containing protein [Clostridia bacterium]|nr:DUF92 domain-containing protein [Clostridia bacterium]